MVSVWKWGLREAETSSRLTYQASALFAVQRLGGRVEIFRVGWVSTVVRWAFCSLRFAGIFVIGQFVVLAVQPDFVNAVMAPFHP